MPTVVIPAYNEAQGIERTLRAVLAQEIANLTVIVVPNACVDDTAARARTVEPRVIVVETATPGKPEAMNHAEEPLRAGTLASGGGGSARGHARALCGIDAQNRRRETAFRCLALFAVRATVLSSERVQPVALRGRAQRWWNIHGQRVGTCVVGHVSLDHL